MKPERVIPVYDAPLEGIVALPMLHKDFKVWLINLFRVFKKKGLDKVSYTFTILFSMSASPPLLKAQLYNRAEVEQYSEKLLAQVGPQKPNTIPKLGQN